MNVTPNQLPEQSQWNDFVDQKKSKNEKKLSSFSDTAAEVTAAGSSVVAYHPLRTIATQVAAGTPVQWQFSSLYRGFFASALGAHQLFFMAGLERYFSKMVFTDQKKPETWKRVLIGASAGLATSLTVTPFDLAMVQKQLKRPFKPTGVSNLYRGFFAVAPRQVGLGAGMFILPSMMTEKFHEFFPTFTEKNEKRVKTGMGFVSGCVTATVTQPFEVARAFLQEDVHKVKYPTTWKAFTEVPKFLASPRGVTTFGVRLAVIAVATTVMTGTRDVFANWFGKEKK